MHTWLGVDVLYCPILKRSWLPAVINWFGFPTSDDQENYNRHEAWKLVTNYLTIELGVEVASFVFACVAIILGFIISLVATWFLLGGGRSLSGWFWSASLGAAILCTAAVYGLLKVLMRVLSVFVDECLVCRALRLGFVALLAIFGWLVLVGRDHSHSSMLLSSALAVGLGTVGLTSLLGLLIERLTTHVQSRIIGNHIQGFVTYQCLTIVHEILGHARASGPANIELAGGFSEETRQAVDTNLGSLGKYLGCTSLEPSTELKQLANLLDAIRTRTRAGAGGLFEAGFSLTAIASAVSVGDWASAARVNLPRQASDMQVDQATSAAADEAHSLKASGCGENRGLIGSIVVMAAPVGLLLMGVYLLNLSGSAESTAAVFCLIWLTFNIALLVWRDHALERLAAFGDMTKAMKG